MRYNPDKHHRRSLRLKGYDYSQQGAYFITICTQNREYLFGDVVDGDIILNEFGEIVKYTWFDLPNHIGNIALDDFIVMPNHIHGIIIIVGAGPRPAQNKKPIQNGQRADLERADLERAGLERAGLEPAPTRDFGLSEIVRQLKTFSAKRINRIRNMTGFPVWQRNYYDHIIRDEDEMKQIREYIHTNPQNWDIDIENPSFDI